MADVNLVVRAHLRGERELNKAERKLLKIAVAARAADNSMASLGASSAKMQKILSRTTAKFEKIMTDWDKLVKGFGVLIVKTLGAATKFMVAEFALVAASMIAVHALFKVGRWLMKGYHGAIKMVAGAAAGATAALSILSAAIREQQAAMFSYKGIQMGFKDLKSGTAAVRMEMRGLATDVHLAALGIENINAIYAGASQRGTFSKSLTKGLMDIASAGQPLEQAAKWVGEVVGLLTDPNLKGPGQIGKAFKSMGELGKETWKKLQKEGIYSVEQVRAAIRSGLVSELAGVEGQWDAVSGTLIGRFKAAFSIIRTDFADVGEAFLGDIKVSLDEMLIIFRRMMFRMRGDIVKFGKGGLLDSLVGVMEGIERNMVTLINKWLPMAEGMFGRIADWWGRFTDGWKRVTSSLAPLISAAHILEDMFMNILRPVGDYFNDSFRKLRIFLIDSKDDFLEHGSAIGRLFAALLKFQSRWTEMFKEAMPFINKLIDGITQLVDLFTAFSKGVQDVSGWITGGKLSPLGGSEGRNPGFGGAYAMMALMQFGRRNRDTEGTIIDSSGALDLKSLSQMNVQAQVVNLSGPGGPAAAGGKGGGKSGYAPYMPGKDLDERATEVGYAPSSTAIGGGRRATPLFGSNVSWDQNTSRYRELGGGGMMPFVSKEDAEKAILSRPRQTASGRWYESARVEDGVGVGGKRISAAEGEMRTRNIDLRKQGTHVAERVKGSGVYHQITQSGKLGLVRPKDWDPTTEKFPNAPGLAMRRNMLEEKGGGINALMESAGVRATGSTDFTKMKPNELAMLMGSPEHAPDQLPLGKNGEMVKNPYKGKRVSRALMERVKGQDPGGTNLRASLKAARARQGMLYSTQIKGMDPDMPKTMGANLKYKMGKRLGTGGAMHQRYSQGLKSFGSRMGIGMGMGVASGFMGEEAQGAMNLGSMVSMINPLLGMGIGFGGAALKAKTVKGGMTTGAAGGAAIGGMFGPGGALVGAGVGALVGGIMGALGKGRAEVAEVKDAAKTHAGEVWKGMISGIDEARAEGGWMTGARMRRAMNLDQIGGILDRGEAAKSAAGAGTRFRDLDAAGRAGHAKRQAAVTDIYENQGALDIEMSADQYEKALKRPFEYLEEILPELTKHHGAAETVMEKYTNRMDHMTGMFGITEDKLHQMADTVGVNLYDATADTTDMMIKLSAALMQTRDQINNIFEEVMNTAYSELEREAKSAEASIGMDESARAFREKAESEEGLAEGDAERFIMDQMGFFKDYAKGDELAAVSMMKTVFAEGGAFTEAGGVLEGMESDVMTEDVRRIIDEMVADLSSKKGTALRQQIQGNLGEFGLEAGTLPTADFMAGLGGGAQKHLDQVLAEARAWEVGGQFKTDDGKLTDVGKATLTGAFDEILGEGVVSGLKKLAIPEGTEALGESAMADAAESFGASVGEFKTTIESLAAKLDTSDTKHPLGDTSSTLAGTLAAHNRISGGLPGKRTITSGYRNYALGSSNSDHINGRALDIVGDNLGAYQRGIKSGGGFAEFHGGGRSRHLHTVPAIGDTSMSKGGLGTLSNTNNYTINVTGGPNANAQEVASLVMNEIQNLDRSNRERA